MLTGFPSVKSTTGVSSSCNETGVHKDLCHIVPYHVSLYYMSHMWDGWSRAERAARRGGPEADSEPEVVATEGEGEEAPAAPRFRPLGQLLEDPEPSEMDGVGGEDDGDDAGAQQDAFYNMGAYSRWVLTICHLTALPKSW